MLYIKKYSGFIISIVIGLLLYEEANYAYTYRAATAYSDHMIYRLILSMGSGSSGWNGILFPILAALPMGISYVREYRSGYLKLRLQKMSRNRYVVVTLIQNAILGGLGLLIPYAVYLNIKEGETVIMFHPELAASNTIAYVCLLGTFVLLAGVTFATFAIGISAWIKNTFLTLILPFVLCIAMAILIPDNRFDLLLIFTPNGYAWASVPIILIMSGILILTGIILFAVGVKNNEK